MRLRALAKINLGLDVVGKRADGYHEVRMSRELRLPPISRMFPQMKGILSIKQPKC